MPGQKTRRRRRMQKATTTRNTRPDSRSFKSATTPTDGSGSKPRHKSGAQPDHWGSRQHHIQARPSRLEAGKDQTRPSTTSRGPSQQSQRGSSTRGTSTTRSRQTTRAAKRREDGDAAPRNGMSTRDGDTPTDRLRGGLCRYRRDTTRTYGPG